MSTTSVPHDIDPAKAEAFAGRFLTALNNGALCLMVSIGHRTGLFDVMSQSPPASSEEIAAQAIPPAGGGCEELLRLGAAPRQDRAQTLIVLSRRRRSPDLLPDERPEPART